MTEPEAVALLPGEELIDQFGKRAVVETNDADEVTLRYASENGETWTITQLHHWMEGYDLEP